EAPVALFKKNNLHTNLIINKISKYLGQDGAQINDIEKIFKAIDENTSVSYFKDWYVSKQQGLVVFINKKIWLKQDQDNQLGYFYFQFTNEKQISSLWSFTFNGSKEDLKIRTIKDGDIMAHGGGADKVSEVLRSFDVRNILREVWPIVLLKDKIVWIPGIKKIEIEKNFESNDKNHIIISSIEKSEIENF
ncbi:MAG: hypothetical protein O3A48_04220, partial [Actinomycetota bacterium]|nr:hypothetical protein [Actinomycetota bacterium]